MVSTPTNTSGYYSTFSASRSSSFPNLTELHTFSFDVSGRTRTPDLEGLGGADGTPAGLSGSPVKMLDRRPRTSKKAVMLLLVLIMALVVIISHGRPVLHFQGKILTGPTTSRPPKQTS